MLALTERRKLYMGDLSVKEVAGRLGLDERTAARYVANGLFPGAYKLNPFAARRSEWRIPEEAVSAFEEKRRETAIKPAKTN
jgi:predicted site-specific integrase-resolvase